jgi:hypothetical protein
LERVGLYPKVSKKGGLITGQMILLAEDRFSYDSFFFVETKV